MRVIIQEEALRRSEGHYYHHLIQELPTIDAVPVEYGQWVKPQGMMPPEYHHRKCCSVCGGWALYDRIGRERISKYCPNCGAKMDLEEPTNE